MPDTGQGTVHWPYCLGCSAQCIVQCGYCLVHSEYCTVHNWTLVDRAKLWWTLVDRAKLWWTLVPARQHKRTVTNPLRTVDSCPSYLN